MGSVLWSTRDGMQPAVARAAMYAGFRREDIAKWRRQGYIPPHLHAVIKRCINTKYHRRIRWHWPVDDACPSPGRAGRRRAKRRPQPTGRPFTRGDDAARLIRLLDVVMG